MRLAEGEGETASVDSSSGGGDAVATADTRVGAIAEASLARVGGESNSSAADLSPSSARDSAICPALETLEFAAPTAAAAANALYSAARTATASATIASADSSVVQVLRHPLHRGWTTDSPGEWHDDLPTTGECASGAAANGQAHD